MQTDDKRLAQYLEQGRLMQLATAAGAQPWVCTVYYVVDSNRRLYWLSYPSRRHSQELAENTHAAIAIVIKPDLPVIGVQAEGVVSVVQNAETVKLMMQRYVAKYGEGNKFYDNFLRGVHQHYMYCFAPTKYVVFDELHTD